MKRSEMLDVIGDVFDKFDGEWYSLAEDILTAIENAGMLPPSTDYFVNHEPEGFQQTWDSVADYHLWEPEDDQKTEES